MKKQFPFIVSTLLLLLIVGSELAAILRMNFGMFVYTLDDAYIHLSIAENIAHGSYGINPDEFASAASSILWPFLLTPFSFFSFGMYVPLVLNVLFSIATLYVLSRIFDLLFETAADKAVISTILLIILIPSIGIVGLIFTGMEHSLQVFSIVLILYTIIKELNGEFDARTMITSIVLSSIVRYEDLSVCLFAIAFFFVRGRKKQALTSLAAMLVLISLFSLFIYINEGSFLPTSVVAKMGSFGRTVTPFSRILETIRTSFGMMYTLFMISLVVIAIIKRKDFTVVVLSSGALFVTVLDLAYGKIQYFGNLFLEFGYFFRYEMYLWTFLVVILIVLSKDLLVRLISYSKYLFVFVLVVMEVLLCGRNNSMVFSIPTASNNIFEQHVQIHQFVTQFYHGPVAVNDIGYVSYNNPDYVQDLWGLTSKKVLSLRKSGPGKSDWIDSLVTEKNISLVIIYDVWFTHLPSHWQKIAEMTLTERNITASENVVSFYAVNNKDEIVQKLRAFQNELHEKEMLRIIE